MRETRRSCVYVDQDTRQAMLSLKMMLVITKEDMPCSECVLMARGTVLVARRWRPRRVESKNNKADPPKGL
jgi:hypothetical protein